MTQEVSGSADHALPTIVIALESQNESDHYPPKQRLTKFITEFSGRSFSMDATRKQPQIETGEVLLASFDLLEGTSASTRAETAETFLELLGARVRNPTQSQSTKRLSGGLALIPGFLFGSSA
jgi:hypothetical protein